MSKVTRLDRRTFLRGAGGVAIALPWLEVMGGSFTARAQSGGRAKKFLAIYTPGGTVRDKWRCAGGETDFQLSPILAPLRNVRDKLLVLRGVGLKSARGEQHQAGIVSLLTGTGQSGAHGNYASGPSIDQIIARRASAGNKLKSLEIAVRWATGNSAGRLHPINALNYEDNANFSPIPPRLDPQAIWSELFGARPDMQRKTSILDTVTRSYVALGARLGASDKRVLDEHLTKVREMESRLQSGVGGSCGAPARADTSGYNPTAELGGSGKASTDQAIPSVGRFMMDMIVHALKCDITSVATLQWTDTEAKHTFPWLGLSEHHHYYQHDGGYRPVELEKIYTWYATQHAYLLEQLEGVVAGPDRTLLDDTVVFVGSELGSPENHAKHDMPLLLAGRGGGLRSGRLVSYNDASHNDLLATILALFGEERPRFGDPQFSSGPLTGLA